MHDTGSDTFDPPGVVEIVNVGVHLAIELDADYSGVGRQPGNDGTGCYRRDGRDEVVAVDHLTAELLNQSGIGLSVEYHEEAGTRLAPQQRAAESVIRRWPHWYRLLLAAGDCQNNP